MTMTKEMREMIASKEALKAEVRTLLAENKVEDAQAKMAEVRSLESKIKIQEDLEADEARNMEDNKMENRNTNNTAEMETRALIKAISGKSLTEEERALVTTVDADGGYLVPKNTETKINELKRQYTSVKTLVDVIPVTSKTGSMVVEDLSTMTDLVDFDEDSDLTEQQPKFKNLSYACTSKGAITPIANALLQDEKADVMGYVGRNFSKKAVRTENKAVFAVLKASKTAKVIADWKALKKSINKDLDPMIAATAVIITNQDGFDALDSAVDANDRPILQVDPTNPTQKKFNGLTVYVFSNNELPTVDGKAPIIFGNMAEAVKFFDRGVYEVSASEHALFNKHQTAVKCIERFDVKLGDADAYIYGEIPVV